MKPNASQVCAACLLLLLLSCASPHTARGQSPRPTARRFSEFTMGVGDPYRRWYRDYEAAEKELKEPFRLYAEQLKKEGARPYAITYGPRVVESEYHARPVAGMRASALWDLTAAGFDWRQINWVDGGFREYAATELWVVPPGAQPPCPPPTVRPEGVAYCPSVYVRGGGYVARPSGPVRFKADVSANVHTPAGASPPRCSPTLDPAAAPAKGGAQRRPRRRSGRL